MSAILSHSYWQYQYHLSQIGNIGISCMYQYIAIFKTLDGSFSWITESINFLFCCYFCCYY